MKLAMRIRAARQNAKLSQANLAENLGVSRGAVANWESKGNAYPAAARLVEMAILTQVSIEWLATGRGRMTRQLDIDDVPAVEGELVYDTAERKLLESYRSCPPRLRLLILQSADAHAYARGKRHRKWC